MNFFLLARAREGAVRGESRERGREICYKTILKTMNYNYLNNSDLS